MKGDSIDLTSDKAIVDLESQNLGVEMKMQEIELKEIDLVQLQQKDNATVDTLSNTEEKSHAYVGESDDEDGDLSAGKIAKVAHQNYHAVIQVTVPNEHRQFYEKTWLRDAYVTLSNLKGFRNRLVEVRSSNQDSAEYVVVLIFDSYETFRAYELSHERKQLLSSLSSKNVTMTFVNAYGGSGGGGGGKGAGELSDLQNKQLAQAVKRIKLQNHVSRPPKALPPPKWKLTLIIIVVVYVLLLLVGYSGSNLVMLGAGMPVSFVIFISVCHVVTFMTYSFLPLVMSVPLIDNWLRFKRRTEPSKMHPLHRLIDQGFPMFSIKMKPPEVPRALLDTVSKLEVRVDKLLEMNKHLEAEIKILKLLSSNGDKKATHSNSSSSNSGSPLLLPGAGSSNSSGQLLTNKLLTHRKSMKLTNGDLSGGANSEPMPMTMAVRHFVKWEHQLDFENWIEEMNDEMKKFKGFEGMISIAPENDGDPYINTFTFSSFEDLMVFSDSSGRKELLCKLAPMLEADSAYQVAEERLFSDAFTELLVPTGGHVQSRPPPLWKVAILTIIPLHIVVWQCGTRVAPYISQQLHLSPYLLTFITTVINVIINSFVALPFMLSQFGDWLNMSRQAVKQKFLFCGYHISFKFLDIGLSFRWKIVYVVVYIGINLILGSI